MKLLNKFVVAGFILRYHCEGKARSNLIHMGLPRSLRSLAMTFLTVSCFLFPVSFLYSQTIELDKKAIDFGNVKEDAGLEDSLSVKNTSGNILRVGVRSSCDCITLNPKRLVIKKNQSIIIKVKLDTTGYNGNFNEKIFIQSNDPENPYITLEVKGYILATEKVAIPITVFDSAGCLFCIELRKNIIPAYQKKTP